MTFVIGFVRNYPRRVILRLGTIRFRSALTCLARITLTWFDVLKRLTLVFTLSVHYATQLGTHLIQFNSANQNDAFSRIRQVYGVLDLPFAPIPCERKPSKQPLTRQL